MLNRPDSTIVPSYTRAQPLTSLFQTALQEEVKSQGCQQRHKSSYATSQHWSLAALYQHCFLPETCLICPYRLPCGLVLPLYFSAFKRADSLQSSSNPAAMFVLSYGRSTQNSRVSLTKRCTTVYLTTSF